jgi:hypothetical protein
MNLMPTSAFNNQGRRTNDDDFIERKINEELKKEK